MASNLVVSPKFAAKLLATTPQGQFFGTGFVVVHRGSRWLVTCQHLLEDEVQNLAGVATASSVQFVNPTGAVLPLNDGRTVVAVRVSSEVADCAAIALFDGETPEELPVFDTALRMTSDGHQPIPTINIFDPTGHVIASAPTDSQYLVQGYPGLDLAAAPTTHSAASYSGMPTIKPWMLTYYPAGGPGFSGGPVLRFTAEGMELIAIHTHRYVVELTMILPASHPHAGKTGQAEISVSGAVPLAPLLEILPSVGSRDGQVLVDAMNL